MTNKLGKMKAYMDILYRLRKIIETEYRAGGRFPSARTMTEKYDFCYKTYIKAMQFMMREGIVYKYNNSGIYVRPESQWTKKIALVLEGGRSCPYVSTSTLGFFLRGFEKRRIGVQLIQAADPDDLLKTALIHGAKAIVWYAPPPGNEKVMRTIQDSGTLPLFVITQVDDNLFPGFQTFHFDCEHYGRKMAELFLSRGHRRILYIYRNPVKFKWNALADTMRKAGIKIEEEQFILFPSGMRNISDLLAKYEPTVLYAPPNTDVFQQLAPALRRLPMQPEIVCSSAYNTRVIASLFPDLNVVCSFEFSAHALAYHAGMQIGEFILHPDRKVDLTPLKAERISFLR